MAEFMNSKVRGALPPRPPTLAMLDNSHAITKLMKPKIRIVHIFAPEVIKTDAANFRELVQRLTGKPTKGITGAKKKKKKKKKKKTPPPATSNGEAAVPRCRRFHEVVGSPQEHEGSRCQEVAVKREVDTHEENVERESWVESSSGYTGFLRDMGEIDHACLLQGLGDLPFLPLSSSHMDVIGEATAPGTVGESGSRICSL